MSSTPSLIVGTAGHIDHGKSTLINVLTGKNPDRLPEELERKITIELGFAKLTLDNGRTLGVVDVPGHERFVRNMVAGATGIDIALLCIAADDGIMPQTKEHLAVLKLLGIQSIIVVITKIDLVDKEWLDFITDEIKTFLNNQHIEYREIIPVSSVTKEGIFELKNLLQDVADKTSQNKRKGFIRMPIDRVFSLKGVGTIVTGTLWSGKIKTDEVIEILPQKIKARVRTIQIHDEDKREANPGNRVALGLASIDTTDLRPGDFLATPNMIEPSSRFDASFTYVTPITAEKPLKTGTRVHVSHGTKSVTGRILFMNDAQVMHSNETAPVQFRLDEPLPVFYEDKYIVRLFSPTVVIGGGEVLQTHALHSTNLDENQKKYIKALASHDIKKIITNAITLTNVPVTKLDIASKTDLPISVISSALDDLAQNSNIVVLDSKKEVYIQKSTLNKFVSSINNILLDFHNVNPDKTGIPKQALLNRVHKKLTLEQFEYILQHASNKEIITFIDGLVGHRQAGAGALKQEKEAAKTLLKEFDMYGLEAPNIDKLAKKLDMNNQLARQALGFLVKENLIIKVDKDIYVTPTTLHELKNKLTSYLKEKKSASASELKDALGTSRKYAIPLLEYFDQKGITRRTGNERTLV